MSADIVMGLTLGVCGFAVSVLMGIAASSYYREGRRHERKSKREG